MAESRTSVQFAGLTSRLGGTRARWLANRNQSLLWVAEDRGPKYLPVTINVAMETDQVFDFFTVYVLLPEGRRAKKRCRVADLHVRCPQKRGRARTLNRELEYQWNYRVLVLFLPLAVHPSTPLSLTRCSEYKKCQYRSYGPVVALRGFYSRLLLFLALYE